MRIIKYGTKLKQRYRGDCKNCGAEIEANEEELRLIHDRDGKMSEIICLQCKYKMWVYPFREVDTR